MKKFNAKSAARVAAVLLGLRVLSGCKTDVEPEPVAPAKAVITAVSGDGKVTFSWTTPADVIMTEVNGKANTGDSYTATGLEPDAEATVNVKFTGKNGLTSEESKSAKSLTREAAATERKAAFDAWVDSPDRKCWADMNNIKTEITTAMLPIDFWKDMLKGISEDCSELEPGYTQDYFETHSTQEAIDDAKTKPNKASNGFFYFSKAPTPKNKFITNQNRMAKAVVKNSHVRMGLAVVVSPL